MGKTREEQWIEKKLRQNPGLTKAQLKHTVGMFSNKNPQKVMAEKGLTRKEYDERYTFMANVYCLLD